jgi:hypothetical protein
MAAHLNVIGTTWTGCVLIPGHGPRSLQAAQDLAFAPRIVATPARRSLSATRAVTSILCAASSDCRCAACRPERLNTQCTTRNAALAGGTVIVMVLFDPTGIAVPAGGVQVELG